MAVLAVVVEDQHTLFLRFQLHSRVKVQPLRTYLGVAHHYDWL